MSPLGTINRSDRTTATTVASRASFELVKGRLYRKLSCIAGGTYRTCASVFYASGVALGADG